MKVSIVTPTYNSEEYLEKCIQSIMGQSHTDYEHIIVDGGSKDRTIEIIKKYVPEIYSDTDRQDAEAMSKGLNNSRFRAALFRQDTEGYDKAIEEISLIR